MPADSYSDILGYLEQGTGNNNNTWGDNANASVFSIFERAIAGLETHSVTGGTLDLSGSPPPAGPSAAIDLMHVFTGNLASAQIMVVPDLPKTYWIYNDTDDAETLSVKCDGGTAVPCPAETWTQIICDGDGGTFAAVSVATIAKDCYFEVDSATEATLSPKDGNFLFIPSVGQVTIPSAGVTVENTDTLIEGGTPGADTTYNVYASFATGSLVIRLSATASAVDVSTGCRIRSGDNTNLLVGKVRTNSSSQFITDVLGYLSYFNRKRKTQETAAAGQTTSTSLAELSSVVQNKFLCWADEDVDIKCIGNLLGNGTIGSTASFALGIDSTTTGSGRGSTWSQYADYNNVGQLIINPIFCDAGDDVRLSEGWHFATLLGATNSGSVPARTAAGTESGGIKLPSATKITVSTMG